MIISFSDSEEHIMQKIMDVLRDVPVVEHPLEQSCILASSDLKIHLKEQTVYRNGERVTMTHHEFFTLAYLAQHPGWVFSKEQMMTYCAENKFGFSHNLQSTKRSGRSREISVARR